MIVAASAAYKHGTLGRTPTVFPFFCILFHGYKQPHIPPEISRNAFLKGLALKRNVFSTYQRQIL